MTGFQAVDSKPVTIKAPIISNRRVPRITGNDVPDDVWRIVANHVLQSTRHHEIYKLISVNRTFFNVVLDVKYCEVRWTKLDGPMVHLLGRLQEPIIASRVRKLFIRAWFVDLLFKQDTLSNKGTPKTLLGRLIRFLSSYLTKKASVPQQDRYEKGRTYGNLMDALSSKEIIHFMINAVSGMTNVTEFNFEWRDLPLNKDTRIFLTSTRKAFDTSLRKLVLRAQVSKFKELLAITNFDNVHELDFHFDYHPNIASESGFIETTYSGSAAIELDIQDLLETVVPFINHRRTSLDSLAISSSSIMDLSTFFGALPSMPALHRFVARIYFNETYLKDVSVIVKILETHSKSLLHVQLTPNLLHRPGNDRDQNLLEGQIDWLRLNELLLTCPPTLSHLESLDIPYISPEQTIPLLHRSRDTLTYLCLTNHFLTKVQATEVVAIFSHRPFEIQHLHIQVKNMEPSLIYMLANRLPGLISLILVYRKSLGLGGIPTFDPPNKVIKTTLLDWKLCSLSVYVGRYQPSLPPPISVSFTEELEVMNQICTVVPSVKYRKGYSKLILPIPFGFPLESEE